MSKRGVAQPGSAPVLGTGGRRFESCRPDFKKAKKIHLFLAFLVYIPLHGCAGRLDSARDARATNRRVINF